MASYWEHPVGKSSSGFLYEEHGTAVGRQRLWNRCVFTPHQEFVRRAAVRSLRIDSPRPGPVRCKYNSLSVGGPTGEAIVPSKSKRREVLARDIIKPYIVVSA